MLIRMMSGRNEVIDVDDTADKAPGVEQFDVFLKELGLFSHDFAMELGQVLKVPCEEIIELGDNQGFICGDARNNILAYLKVRIPPVSISFLQCQFGDAGELNDKK